MKPFAVLHPALLLLCAFLVIGCRTDTDAPIQPSSVLPGPEELIATDITQTDALISWKAPEDIRNVAGYTLSSAGSIMATIDKSATSYRVTGLLPGTDYTLVLEVVYNDDAKSEAAVVGIRTLQFPAPAQPTGFKPRQVRSTEVELIWKASADVDRSDFESYVLLYNGEPVIIHKSATTYTVTGLTPNTPYTFMLTSRTTDGRESITAAFSTRTLP